MPKPGYKRMVHGSAEHTQYMKDKARERRRRMAAMKASGGRRPAAKGKGKGSKRQAIMRRAK